MVDIYQAAKWRGKYPQVATDSEVCNCLSMKLNIERKETQKDDFHSFIPATLFGRKFRAIFSEVNSKGYLKFE